MLYMLKNKMFPDAMETMFAIVRDQAALGLICTSSLQQDAHARMEKAMESGMCFLEDSSETAIEPPREISH